jgi:two-component system chemotaxis response regulator CheB
VIRVLIADDSATLRNTLAALLAEAPDLAVVGQATDGVEAVSMARTLRPDVITMDVNMPRLDGLGAIAAIMAEAPARVLVITSVSEHRQLELSFRAMAAGALELIAKPRPGEEMRAWGRKLAQSVRLMAEVPVVRRPRSRPARPPPPARVQHAGAVDAIALVASTGGPPVLAQVLGALPPDLPVPVLIAQHIAHGFLPGLVRWFQGICALRIQVATTGESPRGSAVYLAPDGCDLEIDPQGLLRTPPGTALHVPSGNRLLHSLARIYGARAAGFVLTGMGDDGAQGLLALRNAGGATFAQDEHSSVVFGMPQAAQACGGAREVLAVEHIAHAILELCNNKRNAGWK